MTNAFAPHPPPPEDLALPLQAAYGDAAPQELPPRLALLLARIGDRPTGPDRQQTARRA